MGIFDRNRPGIQQVLNEPLFTWPGYSSKKWTVSDACRGTLILGASGSGKSSSSGKLLAKSFLKFGYGGLVLCAKKDEVYMWKKLAEKYKRSEDLVIFQNGSNYQFNPLEYEQNREGDGAGDVQNIMDILMALYDLSNNVSAGGGGRADERFWENGMRRLLTRTLQLLQLSGEEISFQNIYSLIANTINGHIRMRYSDVIHVLKDSSTSVEEKQQAMKDLEVLREQNYCLNCLVKASEEKSKFDPEKSELLSAVNSYFLTEFVNLSDRTASVLKESALGIVFPFQNGLLKRHFSTSVSPEMKPELAYKEGKIFIMDISVKEYLLSGVLGQGIFKLAFQQAMERRVFPDDDDIGPRPVFLWADEAQNFYTSHDTLFASTARSSLVSLVNLTQNLPSIIVAMGEGQPRERAMSLIGNLSTKIFHANSDTDTNSFASKMIDQVKVKKGTYSKNENTVSTSFTRQLEYQILPGDFTTLRTGGHKNGKKADAIVTQTGETFSDDKNYMLVTFDQ